MDLDGVTTRPKPAKRRASKEAKPTPPPPALDAHSFEFTPVKPKRVFEEIILQIRRELTWGNLRPGDKLPSERELVRQFGASRTAVREALRTLEDAGIILSRKGVKGGAFVREANPSLLTRLLGDLVSLGSISLESLTEARVHFLDMVIQLATESRTKEHLSAMSAAIEVAEKHTVNFSNERRLEAIGKFYEHLARATGNEVIVMLVQSITAIVRSVMLEVTPLARGDTVKELRAVIEAIRERDAARAGSLMQNHLRGLHQHLLKARDAMKPSRSASGFSTLPERGDRRKGAQ
jgi:DNA-binding FadR family transcriptional regulator